MPELCDAQNSPRQVELQPINRELDTDATASYLKQKEQLAEACDCLRLQNNCTTKEQ
jgi:hypothetical protein